MRLAGICLHGGRKRIGHQSPRCGITGWVLSLFLASVSLCQCGLSGDGFMAFYFTCSNSICGRQLKVRDDLEGRLIACPRCGTNQVAVAEGRVAEDLVRADAAAQARDGKCAATFFYPILTCGSAWVSLRWSFPSCSWSAAVRSVSPFRAR